MARALLGENVGPDNANSKANRGSAALFKGAHYRLLPNDDQWPLSRLCWSAVRQMINEIAVCCEALGRDLAQNGNGGRAE